MAEEAKKLTPEEELLKAATGTKEGEKESSLGEDGDDGLSPDQKLIAELQGKLQTAEDRAKNAEEVAASERTQKDVARKQASTSAERQIMAQEESIKSQLQSAKSSFDSAQKEFEDAHDSGEKKKILDAQIRLNDAQAMLRGAEYADGKFKEWKETSGKTIVDKSGSRFTKVEQEWIDKNPRFNTDRKFRAAVFAANDEAVEKNIEIDSQEYFDHIEKYLKDVGLKDVSTSSREPERESLKEELENEEKPNKKSEKEPQKEGKKQSSSTAAPPGGQSGSGGSSGKKQTFTMTAEHREAARFTFPTLSAKDAEEKYAKYQLEIAEKRKRGEQI